MRLMANSERRLRSWNRFVTRSLGIVPELIGASHFFAFSNGTVTLRLPDDDDIGDDEDALASVGSEYTATSEPVDFVINQVDVEVNCGTSFTMPEEVLSRAPNAYDLVNKEQESQLEAIARRHESLAESAFQYWLRVVRWTCDDYRVGRNRVEGIQSGWTTYLLDDPTNHRVWAQAFGFRAMGWRTVTSGEWRQIQNRLTAGDQPPVHRELLHAAEECLNLGDYPRALVDLAVACETFLRTAVIDKLPSNLPEKVLSYVDLANINQYVSHFFANVRPDLVAVIGEKRFNALKKDLSSLFDRRNRILHSGRVDDLDKETCNRFHIVARELFEAEERAGTAG